MTGSQADYRARDRARESESERTIRCAEEVGGAGPWFLGWAEGMQSQLVPGLGGGDASRELSVG